MARQRKSSAEYYRDFKQARGAEAGSCHEQNGGASAPAGPEENPWPAPLAAEAFHGPLGEAVNVLAPASEADPAALLFQLLVGFGNVVGRGPRFAVEADTHHGNE